MISRNLRIFLFIFAFQVDVHVKAEALNSNMFTFSSENCWVEQVQCGAKSKFDGAQLAMNPVSDFFLQKNAIVIKKSADSIYLASGLIYIKSKDHFKVSTAYGYLNLKKNDEIFLEVANNRTTLRSLQGTVTFVTPKMKYPIVAGFENWFAGLDNKYVLRMGILQPIDFLVQLQEWAKLTGANEEQVKAKVSQWISIQKVSMEESSKFNSQVISRELASQQQELQRQELLRQERAREESRLRRLFREKNFLDP